jgi:hypothetical protein
MDVNKARQLFNLEVEFSQDELGRAYILVYNAARLRLEGAPPTEVVLKAYKILFADLKKRGLAQSSDNETEEEDHEKEE